MKPNSLFPVLLIFSMFIFSQCDPGGGGTETKYLQFETYMKGANAGVETGFDIVVTNEQEYIDLFGEPSDAFDFDSQIMIGSFKGALANSNYGYEIVQVQERSSTLLVVVEFQSCGNTCTRTFSSPYHMVSIAKISKPVLFDHRSIGF
jgi:hypothetical protein